MNLSRLRTLRFGLSKKTVVQPDRRGASRSIASDRRGAPRLIPADRRAWLGWHLDDEFVSVEACLQDISRTGAKLLVEECPSVTQDVWFGLYDGENTVGIEGDIVGSDVGVAGLCVVRLAFRQTCPDPFYNLALRDYSSGHKLEVPTFPSSVMLLGTNGGVEV